MAVFAALMLLLTAASADECRDCVDEQTSLLQTTVAMNETAELATTPLGLKTSGEQKVTKHQTKNKVSVHDDDSKDPCLSTFYFVAGFHHSGTTAMQHELLRRSGANVTKRADETNPDVLVGCLEAGSVLKFPITRGNWSQRQNNPNKFKTEQEKNAYGGYYGFDKLVSLRKRFPNMVTIWLERDIPNTVWSVYKRFYGLSRAEELTDSLRGICQEHLRMLCEVNAAWDSHNFTDRDHTVKMSDFLADPDGTLNLIRSPEQSLLGLPPSQNHAQRRAQQAVSDLYTDQPNLFRQETSADVADWLAALTCESGDN